MTSDKQVEELRKFIWGRCQADDQDTDEIMEYVLSLKAEWERDIEMLTLKQCVLGTADDEFRKRVMRRLEELEEEDEDNSYL